jgi:hypothetical protein
MVALVASQNTASALEQENAALKAAIAQLAEENARLLNEQLVQERLRLMQEQASLQMAAAPCLEMGPPPGLAPPQCGWLGVESGDCLQFRSSFASTCAGSSFTASNFTASMMSDDDGSSISSYSAKTTVMLQNIPNCYSRRNVLEILDTNGFRGFYDLIYLPVDFNTGAGFGYCFVNFVDTEHAEEFMGKLDGFKDWTVNSGKVLEVSWTTQRQGLEAHIDRYRNSPVMHESVPDEQRPALFVQGERVPFPLPTKKLRPPRANRKQ